MTKYTKNPVSKATSHDRSAILIPIKPEFVEKIRNGTKKYELRRKITPIKNLPKMLVIYETRPTQKITGFFQCNTYMLAHKEEIWRDGLENWYADYNESFGISLNDYLNYFSGVTLAYALKISKYSDIEPLSLKEIGINHPPQSMRFLNLEQWNTIFNRRL